MIGSVLRGVGPRRLLGFEGQIPESSEQPVRTNAGPAPSAGRERVMVPSDFTQWISVAALGQTGTSQPPVPGAVGAGNGTTATQGAPAAAPPGGGAPANTPT